ncbi:hypothetical protein GCM10011512_08670 [Tersicoccus solisilvae]|uniref:Tetrapyrrole methylase domain-containing protein n=1 Tax=Tersicoccus solisilvae TaxID=1882339 RepID=A0ABQ1NVS6_9MICC|nr:SAM-dependent methyltransferase [Tersicoccus solisilvae]GGC84123.1 hypothetical protein GCM10011512_08670 [Tersicoccus solisilvae]
MSNPILTCDIVLDHLYCHDEGDGPGNAEPYLWPVFFKVDGDNFAVVTGGGLIGSPTIESRTGGHGNLGTTDVDEGDQVSIDGDLGSWRTTLRPIPVLDPGLRALLGDDSIPGIAGVVVTLMEEDGWPDSLATTGYDAYVDAVRLAVVKVAASFQHALAAPTKEQIKERIDEVKAAAATAVRAAVKNGMSGFELLWYGTFGDNDDSVGTEAFTTTGDELEDTPVIDFSRRWSGDDSGDGDWELFGYFRGIPQLDCSLDALFSTRTTAARRSSVGAADREEALDQLRRFRDSTFGRYGGLTDWWEELSGQVPRLDRLATQPHVGDALDGLLLDAAALIREPERTIDADVVGRVHALLDALRPGAAGRSQRVLRQARRVSEQWTGRTVTEAARITAATRPVGRRSRPADSVPGGGPRLAPTPLTSLLVELADPVAAERYRVDPNAYLAGRGIDETSGYAVLENLRGRMRLEAQRELERAGLAPLVTDKLKPGTTAIDPITINTNNFNTTSYNIQTTYTQSTNTTHETTTYTNTSDNTSTTTNQSSWKELIDLQVQAAIDYFARESHQGRGRLFVIGSGITPITDLGLGAQRQIQLADVVHYCVADPATELHLHQLNPRAHSLYGLYADDKPRLQTYLEMLETIMGSVREGLRVCVVFYGHPGIFAWATHRAIRAAREEGHAAVMLPAVSAQDSLFADLGIDPSSHGLQTVDATDLLIRGRTLDPTSHVLVWQAECAGDDGFSFSGYGRQNFGVLTEYLGRFYAPDHPVVIYDASTVSHLPPEIRLTTLAELRADQLSGVSTLYLPPAEQPPLDEEMMHRLGLT